MFRRILRNPQQRLILLTILAIAGIALVVTWKGRTAPELARPRAAVAEITPDKIVMFEQPEPTTQIAERANQPRLLATMPAEQGAQFSTLIDLQLAAADLGVDLDLTTKQWQALAAAVVQAQTVRHHYEATIAQTATLAPGHYRVEIPAYASAGDELRRQFLADLERGLGREGTDEVMQKLGRTLEGRFAGFGVGAQTLEITGDPRNLSDEVQVERVAKYWNSVDGADRVSTRREVHLPAVEDPTGESWGALLTLVTGAI